MQIMTDSAKLRDRISSVSVEKWTCPLSKNSQGFRGETRGGRPGARPPLAPERGGAPPLQNEKKERMAKISITGIRKPIELL